MKVLQREELIKIRDNAQCMVNLILDYNHSARPAFLSYLKLIVSNSNICIDSQYEGLEELTQYILEDWRSICMGNSDFEHWYIQSADVCEKARLNTILDIAAQNIERILGTKYLVERVWYDEEKLKFISKKYCEIQDVWNGIIDKEMKMKSMLPNVPDDIWTYAKHLGLAGSDQELVKWFEQDIPAYGCLSPMQILTLDQGDNILRYFMVEIGYSLLG